MRRDWQWVIHERAWAVRVTELLHLLQFVVSDIDGNDLRVPPSTNGEDTLV